MLNFKPWQLSLVADIAQVKKNVLVISDNSAGKNFLYWSILIITGEIRLEILSIMAFMEEQIDCLFVFISYISFAKSMAKRNYLFGLNIIVLALTAIIIESNS